MKKHKLPPLGLVLQLFTFVLLPLTLLLVAITFGSISVHQRAMRNLVGDRDLRVVQTAAQGMNSQIQSRQDSLKALASMMSSETSTPMTSTLQSSTNLLSGFDAGTAVFSPGGELIAMQGDDPLWSPSFIRSTPWRNFYSKLVSQPNVVQVIQSPIDSTPLALISAKTNDGSLVVGAFSIPALVENNLVTGQASGEQLAVMLVGPDQQVLYKSGGLTDQTGKHAGVTEALNGESGTVFVGVGGDEHVTAYSPVHSAGWALLTEESWEAVSTPTLRTTQIAPLVLVPAIMILLLALWFGARQVVQPLRQLELKAATLARGDFKTIQEPVGGIAEIQHLQKELARMADKVQDAQRSLHSYIGVITEAQEDERHRIARELHDDTLQALIALKQRVQLAQLELQSSSPPSNPETAELDEIAALTEQTIENLRRLTRALRPVYLEDLGLVPALEMLARETGQSIGITVEFKHQGMEKRLEAPIELALYRMAQEALSNVARHARAKHASLQISFSPTSVVLQVWDDGIGFVVPSNPAEYSPAGHFGLLGLRERASLIGASLDLQSALGKGTLLTVTVPVRVRGEIS